MSFAHKSSIHSNTPAKTTRVASSWSFLIIGVFLGPFGLCFVDLDNHIQVSTVVRGWIIGWCSTALIVLAVVGGMSWHHKIQRDRWENERRAAEKREELRLEQVRREQEQFRQEQLKQKQLARERARDQEIKAYDEVKAKLHETYTKINAILDGKFYKGFDRDFVDKFVGLEALRIEEEPVYRIFSGTEDPEDIASVTHTLESRLQRNVECLQLLEKAYRSFRAEARLYELARSKMANLEDRYFTIGQQLKIHAYLVKRGVRPGEPKILTELKRLRDAGQVVEFFSLMQELANAYSVDRFEISPADSLRYNHKGTLPSEEEMDKILSQFRRQLIPCRIVVPTGLKVLSVELSDNVLMVVRGQKILDLDDGYRSDSDRQPTVLLSGFNLSGNPTFVIEEGALQYLNRCLMKATSSGSSAVELMTQMMESEKSHDEVAYLKRQQERREQRQAAAEKEAQMRADQVAREQKEANARRSAVAEQRVRQERARQERKRRFLETGNLNF